MGAAVPRPLQAMHAAALGGRPGGGSVTVHMRYNERRDVSNSEDRDENHWNWMHCGGSRPQTPAGDALPENALATDQ